ncbi:helix-turn-helix domain-containing protein [Dysgonomonas sp. ZJ279]|uniref:helix-turn-helix domain-containing protein n=1 Tax=Dysgonomonas sp. ZJ279 TaxID=2709796 RepID=UPI001C88050A|nr:helix-turn-helix transcriptional regulator [Dysgonomonas sp. ZJ279]
MGRIKEVYMRELLRKVVMGEVSVNQMTELINEEVDTVIFEAEKLLDFKSKMKFLRKIRGFSLQDLANKMDNIVTRQALHRYEKGDVQPTEEMKKLILREL